MRPKFSIVTLCRNQEEYILDCLDSVQGQYFKSFEHIIVEPGSTDNTRALIEERRLEYGLRCIYESDSGPGEGLRRGFDKASGEFILFINGDDYLEHNALEVINNVIRSSKEQDFLFGGWHYDQRTGRRKKVLPSSNSAIAYGLAVAHVFQPGIVVCNRPQLSSSIPKTNRTSWDLELLYNLVLSQKRKFLRVDLPIATFRLHDSSITGQSSNSHQFNADKSALRERYLRMKRIPFKKELVWCMDRSSLLERLVGYLADPALTIEAWIKKLHRRARQVVDSLCRWKVHIIIATGGLGNRLFQLNFVERELAVAGRRIVLIGFSDAIDILNAKDLAGAIIVHRFSRELAYVLMVLCRYRIVRYSTEEILEGNPTGTLIVKPGLVDNIEVLNEIYFQSADYACLDKGCFSGGLRQAQEYLRDQVPDIRRTYFIHVRRGDYLHWPSRDKPSALPFSWYKMSMKKVLDRDPSITFVVLSDDFEYIKMKFGDLEGCLCIESGSACRDLYVMAACGGGGILSASTFAWWGAYIGHLEDPSRYYLGPEDWLGFRDKKFSPPQLRTSWIEYMKV